ncbi:nitroreductase [Pararhodobacter oceanensis]|uniref:nitroreductase family protein n=1 Tax=Pararhodobacter oceanensis TaxID=2172121 RepID=UPI003A9079E0
MTQLDPNPVMDFLLTRRSKPAKALTLPAPDADTLQQLLTAATRVPDHGRMEPWRFVVLEGAALERLSALVRERGAATGVEPEKIEKSALSWAHAPMIVAVISSPKPSDKIPQVEQLLSSGAVCLSLVNAALATGWGASWITGWAAFDRLFVENGLGLEPQEQIAGFVHLGSCDLTAPERARPDVAALTTRVRA